MTTEKDDADDPEDNDDLCEIENDEVLDKDKIEEWVNVIEEKDSRLVKIATENNAVMIAFIGAYIPKRVSPVQFHRPQIGIHEEFGLENVLLKIEKQSPTVQRLFLLVNSLGGWIPSSYKVARALRKRFKEIIVFVPHIAASGGALIALTGNVIVMGMMSQLSPIDPQVEYHGSPVSTKTMGDALGKLEEYFSTKRPEEAPYPWKAIADKLDPMIIEDWTNSLILMSEYAEEILSLSGNVKAKEIAARMVRAYLAHDQVIHEDEALRLGINVKNMSEYQKEWICMRQWLGKYLFKEEGRHFIAYVLPSQNQSMKK